MCETMDMSYSAPVHFDPVLVVHIVDEAWASDTLPIEELSIPPALISNDDDDDGHAASEENEEDKWSELALDKFVKLAAEEGVSSELPRHSRHTEKHNQHNQTPQIR